MTQTLFFKQIAIPKVISIPEPISHPGLLSIGLSTQQIQECFQKISDLRQKQRIEILSISPHEKFENLSKMRIKTTILEEEIEVDITLFKPMFKDFNPELGTRIDHIEQTGMEWAIDHKLYPENALKILSDTFVSGLVFLAFPEVSHYEECDVFTDDERQLLDYWIRVLFANDEERDVFSLVEHPDEVQIDNHNILKALTGKDHKSSIKILALIETLNYFKEKIKSDRLPGYFNDTLREYLQSTTTEARHQFELTWPSYVELETVKVDSSGSNHAIASGAVLKGLQRDAILKILNCKYVATASAKAVEAHNDVNSHPKELRSRLKKISTVLHLIDISYKDILKPYIEAETPIEQIEDHQTQFLVNFYKKLHTQLNKENLQEISAIEFIKLCLEIYPSFNAIDIHIHSNKTIQESYNIVAERGNNAIEHLRNLIIVLNKDIENRTLDIPQEFKGSPEEFYREVKTFITIAKGWGSQNIWELVAPRYNEALNEVNGHILLDLAKQIANPETTEP